MKVAVTSRSFSKNEYLRSILLDSFPNSQFNDQGISFTRASLIDFLHDADMAIIALDKIDESVLNQLPKLKKISKYGVGYNNIDLQALKKHGIGFACATGVNRRSVAELTLALMITLLRNLPESTHQINNGIWKQVIGSELSNKTVGIIGFGNIGQDLGQLLVPFNVKLLVNDILTFSPESVSYPFTQVSLADLLAQADVVTLHVPLDESTSNILSKSKLQLMKKDSILINCARGGLIDESALYGMLKNKQIHAAALDVFEVEPPNNTPLLTLANFVATSHIGGSSRQAILNMGNAAIEGLKGRHTIIEGSYEATNQSFTA